MSTTSGVDSAPDERPVETGGVTGGADLGWDEPDPLESVDVRALSQAGDWFGLLSDYENVPERDGQLRWPDSPLAACLQVAREAGAGCVVIETRYRDKDYRSEYLAFYSQAFNDVPGSAHRLHFFRDPIDPEQVWNLPTAVDGSVDTDAVRYLGYVIVRPPQVGGVGRAMLTPPPAVASGVRAWVAEPVTFYGQSLTVAAAPFMQQDTQLATCAHAAVWMCHYVAYRRGRVHRQTIGEVSSTADPLLGLGRSLPSAGLSEIQINGLFHQLGVPAQYYPLDSLPAADLRDYSTDQVAVTLDVTDADDVGRRLTSVACRYLNSAVPVLVESTNHAIVLCGYLRAAGDDSEVELVFHDDQRGPYRTLKANDVGRVAQGEDLVAWLEAPEGERVGERPEPEWQALFAPLPEKLWLTAEEAERIGISILLSQARSVQEATGTPHELLMLEEAQQLTFRTYAVDANRFKQRLPRRRMPAQLTRLYRLARWPRLIWVVEAVDRLRRPATCEDDARDADCVLAEVILDPTTSATRPNTLALHVAGRALVLSIPSGVTHAYDNIPAAAYASGGMGPA